MRSSAVELRKRLVQLVGKFPGLHLRELARQASISEAHATYHLELLKVDGFVQAVEDGGFRRYYPLQPKPMGREEQELIGILRQEVSLHIALFLLEHGTATHTKIRHELGLSKATVTYHLKKLEAVRFIQPGPEGAGHILADPARVRALLTRWEPPESLTDKFQGLWRNFYSRQYGRG